MSTSPSRREVADINLRFCRLALSQITPDVKKAGMRVMRDASIYHFRRDHWEFRGPDGFYWHGSAGNAYDARHKGWCAWLRQQAKTTGPVKMRVPK